MKRARILRGILFAPFALAAAMIAILVVLNTAAGRNFAVRKINQYAPGVTVAGLAGHFPADIKLASVTLADQQGVWLSGNNLELRWRPLALLHRDVHITALTAARLKVARAPLAAPPRQKKSSGGLPDFHIALDHLAIAELQIGAALAGQDLDFAVTGQAHLQDVTKGDARLNALAANGQGSYQLTAAIDQQFVDLNLHAAEPPNGLLGHFAGPQVHAPLALSIALHGPRDNAALKFAAALGAAKLDGAGTLGLDPDAPHADVMLNVPALAPFASIAAQNIAGATSLHLLASRRGNIATIELHGNVALTAAPGPMAKLVGPDGQLALLLTLSDGTAAIKNLAVSGAGFSITANGTVAQSGINLHTGIALNNIALLSPGIAGAIAETGTVNGTAKDFAVHAVLSGHIAEKSLPTGPFTVTLDVNHLPQSPTGAVTATGALEGSPLNLDAEFSRGTTGLAHIVIKAASWRSLNAKAALALAPGAKLPTGTASIEVSRLADFRAFVPVPLAGSLTADFGHENAQDFRLNLQTKNLVVTPAIGATNAAVSAAGPVTALLVKVNATIAKLAGFPARIAAAGTVDASNRSIALAALTADWRTLNIKLLGPASIQTQPGLAVRHLALGVAGGSINLDGTLAPLNLRAAVKKLPASLASLASPGIKASGTLSATAALTGTATAPQGIITLHADAIALHTGPAAAVPPANLAATATLGGKTVNLSAQLNAGPNIALNADGIVPATSTGPIALHLTGRADLRLLDPILAAAGTTIRGVITPDLTITGTAAAPAADGTIALADGAVQNIGSGLSLTKIAAQISAANRLITLQKFTATAGPGTIDGNGTLHLGDPGLPLDLALTAANARPISSDLITENLNAALTIKGPLRALALAGRVDILSANINIPKSLPASVANLPIINRGAPPLPPPPPAPDIALNLLLHATNQIFIRGDGLFAELGGRLAITGTAAAPDPEGGFTLIRGSFALGGKTLQFTKGVVSFNGAGFTPTLDLEASNTSGNITATLIIGGTAAKPTITLTSTPPLPSDEVLAYLLFGQGAQNLSAFQAAQLAAALASLAGAGGGADPLGSVRNALGLDELSLGGSGGAPSVQAGRYVAPGVYVGAAQSTTGQGTQATVEINLYKGLKLKTATGSTGATGGNSSSVGLTYQFNY